MKDWEGEKTAMKKSSAVILSAVLALSLTACGNGSQGQSGNIQSESQAAVSETTIAASSIENTNEENGSNTETGNQAVTEGGNILIAYFSVMETDGVDTVGGASRVAVDGEVLGNNQYIAQLIQQETGGDLFSIETVQEYPTIHAPLLEFAYNEKAENARPELATHIENLEQYDTIFLGFPNWNADLPMPLYTFLEEYDFSGKIIIPFTTHGGSGFSRTINTIESLQPGATVLSDGLSISRNNISGVAGNVAGWVQGLGLADR